MLNLTPPRHTPTLPSTSDLAADFDLVRFPPNSNARSPASLEEETADIADEASVRALRQRLNGRALDMLFVNAGIAKSIEETRGTAPVRDFLDMMLINAFSPIRLIEMFEDIVAQNGTIAAMSSELGSITGNNGSWDLYASSKAALNMLMKCYTAHRPDHRRAKLVVAPGWLGRLRGHLNRGRVHSSRGRYAREEPRQARPPLGRPLRQDVALVTGYCRPTTSAQPRHTH